VPVASGPLTSRGGFGEYTEYSDMSENEDVDEARLVNMWQAHPSVALRVKLPMQ